MGSPKVEETKSDGAAAPEVRPRPWQESVPQARAKPQYDPAEVARKYLDDMEKGGRLHGQNRRKGSDD